jgi:tetratricopeptide (TPR) repeat protein
MAHCQIADALTLQRQTAQAMVHYTEAVRLAERACELTDYKEALPLGRLACAYAGTGRFDKAVAMLKKGRELALANGRNDVAASLLKLMESYNNRKPVRGDDGN